MEQQHPPPYPVSWAQRKAVPCAGLCGPAPSGPHARRDSPLTSCTLTGHSWPQSPTTQVFAWASHFQFIQQNGLISLVSKDPKETGPHSLGAMLSRTPGFYLQVVSRKKNIPNKAQRLLCCPAHPDCPRHGPCRVSGGLELFAPLHSLPPIAATSPGTHPPGKYLLVDKFQDKTW